jgi:hypothetical protein
MTEQQGQLYAYLATLAALLVVFLGALITAANAPEVIGKIEAFGLGTLTGGLIGVLRMPTRSTANVEQADTVNQGEPK